MDFVYEEDNLTFAVNDFLDNALQPLFEFTLILGTRDERTHIQGIYYSVLEVLRHLPVHNLSGNAFGYGGLSDARLTYKDRIVLGPAG